MHLRTIASVILSFVPLAVTQDVNLAGVKRAFNDFNISTDAFIKFNPTVLLDVAFPQASAPPVQVHAGVQLARNATAIPPTFSIRSTSINARDTFVVAMVDLDPPTPQNPTEAQIRHFLGGDFHPALPKSGEQRLLNSTAAISEFLQPTPPAGSDPHRYVFLLFKQPPAFDRQTLVTPTTPIENFNISQFAAEVGLGNAIAGTFIRVGPDSNST